MSLQIRRADYRGKDGFLICGRNKHSGIFGTQVFVETREAAEHCRVKLNLGLDLTSADLRGEVKS